MSFIMLLNYEQAGKVCEHYQYLIGNHIKKGWKTIGIIKAVVIAPYDDMNKHRFLDEYYKGKNVEMVLSFYTGKFYDILLVGESTLLSHDPVSITLNRYLQENQQPETIQYSGEYLAAF